MSKTSGTAPADTAAHATAPAPLKAARGDATRWAWLPAMMPTVARLMAERRAQHGPAHMAECWRRGVMLQEPGWFFAREGALAVGTPFDDQMLRDFGALIVKPGQALLMVADPIGGPGVTIISPGPRLQSSTTS